MRGLEWSIPTSVRLVDQGKHVDIEDVSLSSDRLRDTIVSLKQHHLIAVGLLLFGAYARAQTPVRVVNGIAWAGRGVWLKADLHTHTRFSDGGPLDELIVAAGKHGCDVVAITDHTDFELKAATAAYNGKTPPIDRWDPLVAEVGGTWDQWLGAGLDVWAATASSDFHNEQGDFWPCQFATTWLYAPDVPSTA